MTPCRSRLAPAFAGALSLLCLAGCGGGDDGADAGSDASRYLPLAVGNHWVYHVTRDLDGDVMMYPYGERWDVTGPRSFDGHAGVDVSTRTLDDDIRQHIALAASGGLLLRLPDDGGLVAAAAAAIGPQELLRLPLPAMPIETRRQADYGRDLDYDRVNETVTVESRLSYEGTEDVDVLGERFRDALRMRLVSRASLSGSRNGAEWRSEAVDETFWFAKGVGIVRNEVVLAEGGFETRQLAAWQIDGRRGGDRQPPVLEHVFPSDGARIEEDFNVNLYFSEAVDGATLRAGGFELRNAAGELVPGELIPLGDQWVFANDEPLPAGRYTARVTTAVRDGSGDPLVAGRTWTFERRRGD